MHIPDTIYISKKIIKQIQDDCRKRFPMEACGFLIGSNTSTKVINDCKVANNMSKEPNRYNINPYEYYELEKSLEGTQLKILGFYHSHPNSLAKPSIIDRNQAWNGHSYVIVSLTEDKINRITSWLFESSTDEFFEEQVIIE